MDSLIQLPAESRLAEKYEALFRVSQAISAHRDPKRLFSTLASELRQVIDFAFIGIAQYEEPIGRAAWLLTECRHGCEHPAQGCVPESALLRSVFEQQEPLVIPLLKQEDRFQLMKEHLGARGIQSVCVLPLTTVHRRLGILSLGSEQAFAYSDGEVTFLKVVANQVALAMDDAMNIEASRLAREALKRNQDELQRERDRLKLLLDVNNSVISILELKDLLRSISASVRRVMQCDAVSVDLPDSDPGHLRVYALDFPESKGLLQEEVLIPIEDTVPGLAFRTGKPQLCSVSSGWNPVSCNLVNNEGIKSGCLLPLISRNRTLGVLALGSRQPDGFTREDVAFLMQASGQIAIAIDNALAYGQIAELKDSLTREKLYLLDEIRSERNFDEIIGTSSALRRVLGQVKTVAPADSAVLILGETGTGKELIARAIHNLSRRNERTFVKLNCAAIPTGLLESELFGHEKGAFTGAIAQRIGRFELANRGTVFLDEISEIPIDLQPKLLRVLQEREFERLGSTHTLKTDARLIAATNRDLAGMVTEQMFRADLFYRVNVFPITIPPLRERQEDIPLLVRHFAQQFARRNGKAIETISAETMNSLVRYHWPGNVRELENVIERAVLLSRGPDLNIPLSDLKAQAPPDQVRNIDTLHEAERKHILSVLEETNWVLSGPNGAAVRLGLKRSTLQFRMKKMGISRSSR